MRVIIALLICAWSLQPAVASAQAMPANLVEVCPVLAADTGPPTSFDRPDCEQLPLHRVDPQGTLLWLRLKVSPPASDDHGFVGLLISGKAASEIYLNGELVGRNGIPGADRRSESPGRMDAVLPLNPRQLIATDGVIVLKMSAQHGWLHLISPLHGIDLVDTPDVHSLMLRYYLPALLPLGVFLLAAFYFGSLTLRSERKAHAALLTALALLAAAQLLFEVSRGVIAYSYPLHDLRLIGIVTCASAFGLCLAALLWRLYASRWLPPAMAVAVLSMAAAHSLLSAMDARTAAALLIGSVCALAAALIGVRAKVRGALPYALGLSVFSLFNLLDPSAFIDYGYYLLGALLMVVMMILQAAAYSRERDQQVQQRLRADRLQRALDQQASERSPQSISVPATGKMRQIAVEQIVRIQGAGDYAELHLDDGSRLLHSATLNELDAELPPSFLRVHRSHLVNTRFIERLERHDGGTGLLYLKQGDPVPVSRRVMPGVRRALR
ncbi:MAG: LytTR family transcriptional regulator [Xanthomonadales bacterium]|nr:LytTR family transcriptional regulator [Xanthomonadales bacterium]